MSHFSSEEILIFGLVNKLWNFEAKSLLLTRGTVAVKVDSRWDGGEDGGGTCGKLKSFASLLTGMFTLSPSSALHIRLSHCHPHECQPTLDEDTVRLICGQVRIKSLYLIDFGWASYCTPKGEKEKVRTSSKLLYYPAIRAEFGTKCVHGYHHCKGYQHCNSLASCKSILTNSASQLQDLAFEMESQILAIDMGIRGIGFPQLQTLGVYASAYYIATETWYAFLREIVDNAPNLKQVHFGFVSSRPEHTLHIDREFLAFEKFVSAVVEGSKARIVYTNRRDFNPCGSMYACPQCDPGSALLAKDYSAMKKILG